MIWGVSYRFLLFVAAATVFFLLFPEIDLIVSSLFYTPEEGFFWSKHPVAKFIYQLPKPVVLLAVLSLVILLIDLAMRKRLFSFRPLILFYFAAVMTLGPGLIVHNLFKDNWGRARPSQVSDFNGTKTFTPAWVISDQCARNCSFVSGHSAGAFGTIALALLAKRRRRLALVSAIAFGSLVGLGRIVQGGHFFSDVFFSFVFVFLTAKILYHFTFEKHLFDFIDRRSTP